MRNRNVASFLVMAGVALLAATGFVLFRSFFSSRQTDDLLVAAQRGDLAAVKSSLGRGKSANASDLRTGHTPLMYAALAGQSQTAHLLLKSGADVNATSKSGETALMLAAMWGHSEIANSLIAKGAQVNAKANDGRTALSLAISHTRASMTQGHSVIPLSR
jgi:ankyrin repeat protein